MRKLLCAALLLVGADAGEWISKTPLDVERYGHALDVVESKLYVIGGTSGSGYLDTVEVFDPVTNNWTYAPPMPTATSLAITCIASYIEGRNSSRFIHLVS